MSCTEIYAFKRNGEAVHFADVTNAWRGGMAVWRTMEERHLPQYIPNFIKDCWWYHPNITAAEMEMHLRYVPSRVSVVERDAMQGIWQLANNKDVSLHERIVLFTTFDNCLVKKENLPKVIEAFYNFGGDTSLPEQASVLELISDSDEYIAVGWNQTSVNGDTWDIMGGYDPETEENLPYNCLTMDEHYWLFDELDEEEE